MITIGCKLGGIICKDENELEDIIIKCANSGYDDMWLTIESEFPNLSILVNKHLACVHYFEAEGVFFQSEGDITDENVSFEVHGEISEMPGYTVVSLDSAIQCAKEFFHTQKRSDLIRWNEL